MVPMLITGLAAWAAWRATSATWRLLRQVPATNRDFGLPGTGAPETPEADEPEQCR